jgi:MFS family permease
VQPGGQDNQKPKAQNFVFVSVIVLLAGIALALIQCKVPSILPELTALFAMDAQTASWLMSTFTIVGIVAAIPLGSFASKYGPKRILLISGIIAFVGSVLGAAVPEGGVFIASRALEGIALTAVTICGPAILRACVKPERVGTAMGIWTIWFSAGSTAAGIITPLIFTDYGYQIIWIVYAVIALVAVILVQLLIKMPVVEAAPMQDTVIPTEREARRGIFVPSKIPQSPSAHFGMTGDCRGDQWSPAVAGNDLAGTGRPMAAPTGVDATPASAKPRYRELLSVNIALFMVAFAVYCLLVFSLVSYVPTVLQIKGYEPVLAGFISTIPLWVSGFSSPIFGIIYDKVHHLKLLMGICFAVLGICVPLMFVLTGPALIVVAVISGLFGNSGASVLLIAYLSLLPRSELMEQAMGIFILVQGVGQFLGSFLVQALLGPDLSRFSLCAGVLFTAGIIGTICVLICKYKQPQQQVQET